MSNPFGISDDVFADMIAMAIASAMANGGRRDIKKPDATKAATPAEGAKAAKEIYDSYVAAGFSEEQSFDLLKLVLTHKN